LIIFLGNVLFSITSLGYGFSKWRMANRSKVAKRLIEQTNGNFSSWLLAFLRPFVYTRKHLQVSKMWQS
jgi:hypothetical protein